MRPIVYTSDFSPAAQALFQSYVRNAENDEQGMTKEEFTNLMRLHGIEDDKFLESKGEIRLPSSPRVQFFSTLGAGINK
jgi:hypothetical protein